MVVAEPMKITAPLLEQWLREIDPALAHVARPDFLARGLLERLWQTKAGVGRPACTGVAAAWCPIHGDCSCRGPEKNRPDCPLHGTASTHPEAGGIDLLIEDPLQAPHRSDERLRLLEAGCRTLADAIGPRIPAGIGWALFLFDLNRGGHLAWIANAQRPDMIRALCEFLARQATAEELAHLLAAEYSRLQETGG